MNWRPVALLLLLAGCDRAASVIDRSDGAKLEAAATEAGLVPDPKRRAIEGAWALDTDRLCIVGQRIGVAIDYGEGQSCSASGTVQRDGETLKVTLGNACRFDAQFDGERIRFPTTLPAECEQLCLGRASLAALTVEQQSGSQAEAATLRGRGGKFLCKAS
ncbi:hypothetical protein [Sphingomonas sp. S-NIH.Pt15_0812]|jgi:hypothetical protein|uniref:hypothetical protein n=1 Tax=Sphingomonas sp. S-NIH.Pt15_0812 TaxID=1920129 RepID=UPI001F49BF0C|nr:hypothetical protein [Sphingomonas sp. S-NIH.Pt15_0812]